jgi:hypothetical protein
MFACNRGRLPTTCALLSSGLVLLVSALCQVMSWKVPFLTTTTWDDYLVCHPCCGTTPNGCGVLQLHPATHHDY